MSVRVCARVCVCVCVCVCAPTCVYGLDLQDSITTIA